MEYLANIVSMSWQRWITVKGRIAKSLLALIYSNHTFIVSWFFGSCCLDDLGSSYATEDQQYVMPDIKQLKNCTQRIKMKKHISYCVLQVQGKDCTIIKLKSRKVRDVCHCVSYRCERKLEINNKTGWITEFSSAFLNITHQFFKDWANSLNAKCQPICGIAPLTDDTV